MKPRPPIYIRGILTAMILSCSFLSCHAALPAASTAQQPAAPASVSLSPLFSDHAVLQREMPVPVWGFAEPGDEVTVEFAGQSKKATAAANGKWMARLDPLLASAEPRDLIVESKARNFKTIVHDILVGDVWLCSGQSNMGFDVKGALNAEQEIAASLDPLLRIFQVDRHPSVTVLDDTKGQWELADPKTVGKWSAVSYFFARELRANLKVPIALLHSSWGGVSAECWSSKESLDTVPEFKKYADTQLAELQRLPDDEKAFPSLLESWIKANHAEDAGNKGLSEGYARPDFDDNGWQTVKIRQHLDAYGLKGGGVVWYRKTIDLPEGADKANFLLNTDWLSGAFNVYFNGTELEPAYHLPRFCGRQYRFIVPKSLILAGKPNVIAIRQYALTTQDAFWQETSKMELPVQNPTALDDNWKFKIEQQFPPLTPEAVHNAPKYPKAELYSTATVLYNGMLAPLIPYGIKGAIWYQGESNVPRAGEYQKLLTLMIHDWRARWGEGDFPFYIVQLANNEKPDRTHKEHAWPVLREAQMQTLAKVPNTGMAVAIDVGSDITIHPKDKQDVGQRLALWARAKTYGEKGLVCQSPLYKSHAIEGSKVRVQFDTGGSPLIVGKKEGLNPAVETPGAKLDWFEIAGADGKYAWADAVIEGDSVVVSSPEVPTPVSVRYAWAINPQGCNLYNKAGLPASPFRTVDEKTPSTGKP